VTSSMVSISSREYAFERQEQLSVSPDCYAGFKNG
jgi:hypothetical protein